MSNIDSEDFSSVKQVKTIAWYHFLYFFVFFILIISAIISLVFGGSGRAGENLNFGATLVSIILAVIAILYTLFDSTSSKRNAEQTSKSIKVLGFYSKELKRYTEDISNQISDMKQLNSELLTKLVEVEEWRKQMKEEIESTANEAKTIEEFKKVINESLNSRPVRSENLIRDSVEKEIIRLMENNNDKKYWSVYDFRRILKSIYSNIDNDSLNLILHSMKVREILDYSYRDGFQCYNLKT